MFEYRVRLVLAAAMFVALFLPLHPQVGPVLTWIVGAVLYTPAAIRFVLLSYPCLILLSAYLAFSPTSKLKIVYRVLLFVYLPLKWVQTLSNVTSEVQIGYWAEPVLLTVAALVEILLLVRGWLGKKGTQAK
jgi:hypothetical protein